MQTGGQVGGVRVPVEDVERGRRLAEQVVVDHVGPDQVVRPQPGEDALKGAAVQIPAPGHVGDAGRGDLVAHERAGHAGALAVDHADAEHDARDAVGLTAVGEGGREACDERPAAAVAGEVAAVGPGDRAHRLERLERRRRVALQVPAALLLARIAPRHREHLLAAADEVLDHAATRRQVDEVVAVDHRRDAEQRHRADRRGLRRVLDQLELLRAQHDGARRGGEILAHRELRGIRARRQPRRGRHVAREVARAAHEVRPAGLDRRLQRRRVGPREVGRRERVEQVLRREADAALVLQLEPGVVDQLVERPAGGQVALHEPAEQPALGPRRIGEAAVAARRLDRRAARGDTHEVGAEAARTARDAPRTAREAGAELHRLRAGKEALARAAVGVGEQDVERRARRAQLVLAPRGSGLGGRRAPLGCLCLGRHALAPLLQGGSHPRSSRRPRTRISWPRMTPEPIPPPGALPPRWWGRTLPEFRFQAEMMRLLVDPVFHGRGVPRGDGRPVLLLPGFAAGDYTLGPMAVWLRRIGYRPSMCGFWLNADCNERAMLRIEKRVDELSEQHGRPLAIIGHSRGGYLAKALAARRPAQVSDVIALGAGLERHLDVSAPAQAAVALFRVVHQRTTDRVRRRGCMTEACACAFTDAFTGPFPDDGPAHEHLLQGRRVRALGVLRRAVRGQRGGGRQPRRAGVQPQVLSRDRPRARAGLISAARRRPPTGRPPRRCAAAAPPARAATPTRRAG